MLLIGALKFIVALVCLSVCISFASGTGSVSAGLAIACLLLLAFIVA